MNEKQIRYLRSTLDVGMFHVWWKNAEGNWCEVSQDEDEVIFAGGKPIDLEGTTTACFLVTSRDLATWPDEEVLTDRNSRIVGGNYVKGEDEPNEVP